MKPQFFHYNLPFELENGEVLPHLTIAYNTYGKLNASRDNVIWICHALTADSDAQDWWPQMIGKVCVLNTDEYFVICANILGSCYGTTGPLSTNPKLDQPYYGMFPFITIRDMVNAHELLRQYLFINKIQCLIGGSMGGYQALEWIIIKPDVIKKMILLATSARETAWGIAIHTAQRMAIEADSTFNENSPKAGEKGMAAARAMAMITYRNYEQYVNTQTDMDRRKLIGFAASEYIRHQGKKLIKRFNAFSYYTLTLAMDTHNIARKRSKTVEDVLKNIWHPTLIFSMKDDLLCPFEEQKFLADHIPNSNLVKIDTHFGHDGFLVETKQITNHIEIFLSKEKSFVV
jgi:homoserine O-acetyltransferase/O-succinyltransferase